MNKKPTYWRWLIGVALMLFIWGNSNTLYAQSMADRAKEAMYEVMHGPTVNVPYSGGTRAVGDNCAEPIVVNIPADLPYADLGNTTCGRGNTYSDSDLGSYDNGEDIIYMLNVTATTQVTITMDPKGTTWTGLGLFTSCPTAPLGAGNFWTNTGSSGIRTITRLLPPGTYYVMADTWPTPNCIPSLDMLITMPPPPPANDLCANAQVINCGDVINGNSLYATNTGAPTGCDISLNTAPGVWYTFTGNGLPATLSLAGSAFDTRIGVFSGACGSLTCIDSDDDGGPGVTSELTIPTTLGDVYTVYVTGWSTQAGAFTLSVSCVNPGLEILNPNLAMGYRPIGAWMEPARFEILNNPGAGDLSIIAADIDNNYGGFVSNVAPALPYTLASGATTTAFGLTTNVEATAVAGSFTGQYAIIFGGNRALATATYEGTAYVPIGGDVVETATVLAPNPSPAPQPLPIAATREAYGWYKNYILPNDLGNGPDEFDAVFKLEPAVDMLFTQNTFGGTTNIAVYAEGFEGEGGPMAHNAMAQGMNTLTDVELSAGNVYYAVLSSLDLIGGDYTLVPMPAPDAVTYIAPLDGALNITNGTLLSWTFGNNTSEYELVLGTTYPPTTVVVPFTSTLATSYALTGLQPNMQYFWRVNVKNTQGTTAGPVWGFTTTIDVPTAFTVTLVDPAPTANTVTANLNWTGPSDRAFVGYNVYRNGIKLNTTPITVSQYADLGLARNTTYAYTVSNVFDEGESAQTAPVSVTTKGVGIFNGYVYDFLTNDPIEGARVDIAGPEGTYSVLTAANGAYSTQAYRGTFSVTASATDYTTQIRNNQILAHGATVTNTFYLMETPYPVADVIAFELDANKVQVSWGGSGVAPINGWLTHDDGTNYDAIGASGIPMACASRWTPDMLAPYAGTQLTKVSFFPSTYGENPVFQLNVWTGSGPTLVRTQNITSFIPGQWNEITLSNPVNITGTEEVWFGYTIVSYTGWPAGVDDGPAINNYGNMTYFEGVWSTLNDLGAGLDYNWNLRGFVTNAGNRSLQEMVAVDNSAFESIRPGTTNRLEASGNINTSTYASLPNTFEDNGRAAVSYDVWREKVYQPETLEKIGTVIGQEDYVDFSWGTMDWGVYRWAVTVNYDAGQVSAPAYSNTLDKDMNTVVDVTVTLNSGDSPAGTEVTFTNISEPDLELVYEGSLDGSGQLTWDMFRKGVYNIEVFKAGYSPQSMSNVEIFTPASFEWLLLEILAGPTDLYVTPTGFATWMGGVGTPFEPFTENFDATAVGSIPAGWSKSPETANWAAHNGTQAGGTANQMRFYWSPSGTQEFYLKTPVMSTAGQTSLQFSFKHSINDFNGNYTLRVVAIADGVEHTIQEWLTPTSIPATTEVYNLTSAHGLGAAEFQIAWVYDGYSYNINNWYLDDVSLVGSTKSPRSFQTYKVFHDGVLVADVNESNYQYGTNGEALVDGETYLAEVATVYSTGQSPRAAYTWTYIACGNYATPGSFAAAQVQGALDVNLTWTIPTIPVGDDQIAFARIYRDGVVITETPAAMYLDEDLDIGTYQYCITFVYASGAETCPGTICQTVAVTGGGFVSGNVSQAAYLGGDAIQGAAITLTSASNTFTFTTDVNGNYSGEVLGNQTYNYTVEATGYITQTLAGIEILMTETEVRDFLMMEFPAPVELVYAEELNDNQVKVSWRSPGTILFEPYMENFTNGLSGWTPSAVNWGISQTASAGGTAPELRFNWSPSVTGDFSIVSPVLPYANSNNALYLSFKHMVNDFSGGYTLKVITIADGVTHVVQSWTPTGSIPANTFNTVITDAHGLNAAEFQIGFMFSGVSFDINYWYIDDVVVTNTRARNNVRDIPESTLAGYNVYRTTCVDGGDLQFLGYTLDSIFNDNTWGTAEAGTYKWAVEAVYAENEAEIRYSNCLDKDMVTAVSVTVITNSGDSPDGTKVTLTNTSEPELGLIYEVRLDDSGYFVWEDFRKGTYDVYVDKNGFAPISETIEVDGPVNLSYILEELLSPVSDLHVSPTGYATWHPGGVVPFEDVAFDFEADEQGWEIQGNVNGWQWGNNASLSSSFMNYNGNATNFIAVNADAAGSGGSPIVAMTKSPMMNLQNADEVYLSFIYTLRSDAISVHYSIAAGAPVLIENLAASSGSWTNKVIMLPEEALAENVQIIFLYTEASTWSYGGGVDNVMLTEEAPDNRVLEYYKVWLDGIFTADTPNAFYQYDPATLTPGQEYFSEVAALYSNGMSAKMNYTWTYYPCDSFPGPGDLTYEIVDVNNVVLNWSGNTPPPPPGDGFADDFETHTNFTIDFAPWTNLDVDGSTTYGMTGITWPNAYAAQSFIVFNPSATSPALDGADAHSGSKYVACFAAVTAPNNDWLISPAVTIENGNRVSFWAKSYTADYGLERFKVGVSTTGLNPSDFTIITSGSYVEAPAANWTEFTYDLSSYAGQSVYVGIQCVSNDAFFLMVDDFAIGAPTARFASNTSPVIGNEVKMTRSAKASIGDINLTSACVAEKATPNANAKAITGIGKSLAENRAVLFNNGPMVNSAGTGAGGADESILDASLGHTSYGFNVSQSAGYHMADDFVVDATWTVESMEFFGYQTGSSTTSSFTGLYFQIYNGAPNAGGTVIFGDMTTNRMSSTSWTNIYRNDDGPGGSTNRPIMKVVANVTGLTLQPGTYWVEYTLAGSLGSGPWSSPITINGQAVTGNALQWTGSAWQALVDGVHPQGIPFLINGTTSGGGTGGSTTFDPGEFLGANVYRNGELIAEMVQGETYTDSEVEPGYYDYCVVFVYEDNAMSCMTNCVTDVLVTEDCKVPQNLTATTGAANEVTLAWNQQVQEEFRYDDGTSTGQLGFSGGTINGVLGAKHNTTAEITELSWFTTAEGGPHTTVQIYVFGLTSAGMPNGGNVLYTASVTNTDNSWNTHTLPTPVTANGGFYIALGFNGFAGLGTDDGVGAPYVFPNNTHYYSSDYTGNSWTTFESSGFPVNAMIRAIGMAGAKASYAVAPEMTPVNDKTQMSVIYTTNDPVATGSPQWSVPARDMNRAFLGYNIYKNGSLFVPLWPDITYVYQEGVGGQTCYTVTAEYEFCGETDPSNEACVTLVNVKPTDLSQIRVYPNPTNNTVNIDLTSNVNQVVIYNYLGQVVFENNITDQTTLQIDVRNYEAGAYLVKFITSEGQSLTKKVVVTK